MESHSNDRLTRLEVGHEHMEKTLDQLVRTTTEVGKAVTKLADNHRSILSLNEAREDHATRIALLETRIDGLDDLPGEVAKNTLITKAGIWTACAVITVVLGAVASKLI